MPNVRKFLAERRIRIAGQCHPYSLENPLHCCEVRNWTMMMIIRIGIWFSMRVKFTKEDG